MSPAACVSLIYAPPASRKGSNLRELTSDPWLKLCRVGSFEFEEIRAWKVLVNAMNLMFKNSEFYTGDVGEHRIAI